jgi:hypothetical protein
MNATISIAVLLVFLSATCYTIGIILVAPRDKKTLPTVFALAGQIFTMLAFVAAFSQIQ